ncbi:MAG: T9SS type A sorting domain-containing protein [Chitinophagaceae bacterium]
MKKFYSLIIILLLTIAAWSQSRKWIGGSGNWTDITNWEPAGVPMPSDILEFNGVSATISNVTGPGFSGIILTNSNIILNGSGQGAKTLTIGDPDLNTAITIHSNASLTIGNNLDITLANNSRSFIDGTLILTTDRNYFTNTGEMTRTIVNGVIQNNGGNIFSELSNLEFNSGSQYEHARDKGEIPAASWHLNSTCNITGVISNAPVGTAQLFGNYKWDCPNQIVGDALGNAIPSEIKGDLIINKVGDGKNAAAYLSFPASIKIGGSFILVSGACFSKQSNVKMDIAGDFIIRGGSLKTNEINSKAGIELNFIGTARQSYSKTGGVVKIKKFTVKTNAEVDFGESVLSGEGDFILSEGSKLITSHPGGIALTGATGSVQVTGSRVFAGNADYVYSGSAFQVTGTGLPSTIRRLVIDNKAGLFEGNGVKLSKPTLITTELVLSNGFLQTSENSLLIIGAQGVSTTAGNAFVAGPIRKTGNTSFLFPTGWAGTGGGRIPIGISDLDKISTIQAEYKRASAIEKGSTINAPLHHISFCDYWELFPINGNTSAIVTLYSNVHSACYPGYDIHDFKSIRVARSNGISWTQVGNTSDSLDSNNGYLVAGDSSVSISSKEKYFTLGNITSARDPLPVMFDNVLAYEKNSGVKIEWSNLTERDVAIYYVERSFNGMDYTIIGQYFPINNHDDKASYTHFDASPQQKDNYYRIKVIVKNTKIIFSKVMRTESAKTANKLTLFPNPVVSPQFYLGLSGIVKGEYSLNVINAMGQQMYQCNFTNNGNTAVQQLTLPSSIKPGIYNLIISGNNYHENKMFVVQ